MKMCCWWNESAKSGKDTGCEHRDHWDVIQSDEGEVGPADPAQWLYSETKREPTREDFLIDS